MRHVLGRLLLVAGGLAVALGIAEAACRQFFAERLAVVTDERNLLYRFDATLGWFPTPSTEQEFLGERRIKVHDNALGLRDVEFVPPTAGRPRLAFFGDSFVWGYDAEASERFTDLLRARHPEWDVMNCGVSGYGTDQALLLLERLAPVLRPDVVVLEFNPADRNDNILAVNHGGYAKPVFRAEGDTLTLVNVPVPLLAKARWAESPLFRRSYAWRLLVSRIPVATPAIMEDPTDRLIDRMQDETAASGARFVILLNGVDARMTAHAAARGIPIVEVEPAFRARADPAVALRYTGHGPPWTPEGHRVIAGLLEPVLAEAVGNPTLARPSARE